MLGSSLLIAEQPALDVLKCSLCPACGILVLEALPTLAVSQSCLLTNVLMMQEIQLLERISHDRNIVQFYGACLETKPPMLIMEYMGVRMHSISGSTPRPGCADAECSTDTHWQTSHTESG